MAVFSTQMPNRHNYAVRSLLIALVVLPCAAFAQKNVIHSDWRLDTAALRPSHGMMRYYDRGTKLAYAFHNDGNALLVTVRGADPAMARRMVQMGMVLTIDTLGKKKGGSTIEFPLPTHNEHTGGAGQAQGGRGRGSTQAGHHMNTAGMNMRLNTLGFKGLPDGAHAASGEAGIQAHFDMDSMDVATYHVRVPFRSILGREIIAADTLKAWSIRVTVNASTDGGDTHEQRERSGSGMGSTGDMGESGGMGGGHGGGGRNGGGSRGGLGGGGHGDSASAEMPASFRLKVKLAFRP